MRGIFEVVSVGMQETNFGGKVTHKLSLVQDAQLKTAKVEDDMLEECKKLPLYKPVRLELDINDGIMNNNRYVSYKVVRIVSSEQKK